MGLGVKYIKWVRFRRIKIHDQSGSCGDNAAQAEALNAMLPYFMEHAANANALYAEGRRARAAIDAARRQIADAIHAKPAEILTHGGGGSEADNWALFGAMPAMAEKPYCDPQVEHHAILNACAALEKLGYEVSYVPVDRQGCVDPEAIENAVRPETGMVSVMLANNEVGTIHSPFLKSPKLRICMAR